MKQAAINMAALALLQSSVCSALAAEPPWPNARYEYVVVDQDLKTVLEQFAINNGLRISISDTVKGRISGRLESVYPRQFLTNLAKIHSFDWFYDGGMLWISAGSEAETKMLNLRNVTFAQFKAGLSKADLLEQRFSLRPGLGPNAAIVSGPPRFVTMIREAAETMPADEHVPKFRTIQIIQGTRVSEAQVIIGQR